MSVYVFLGCSLCREWCDAATLTGKPLSHSEVTLCPFISYHGLHNHLVTFFDDTPDGWLEWTRFNCDELFERDNFSIMKASSA